MAARGVGAKSVGALPNLRSFGPKTAKGLELEGTGFELHRIADEGPSRRRCTNGVNRMHHMNHLFQHPEWSRITFGKTRFSPIFDPFLVPKRPIFKAFWDFPWPIMHHHGLKMAQKHLFEHHKWSRNNFGKNDFFRPGEPGGPTVGPHRARAGLPSGCTK